MLPAAIQEITRACDVSVPVGAAPVVSHPLLVASNVQRALFRVSELHVVVPYWCLALCPECAHRVPVFNQLGVIQKPLTICCRKALILHVSNLAKGRFKNKCFCQPCKLIPLRRQTPDIGDIRRSCRISPPPISYGRFYLSNYKAFFSYDAILRRRYTAIEMFNYRYAVKEGRR